MRSFMFKAGAGSLAVSAVLHFLAASLPSRSIASGDELNFHLQKARVSIASRLHEDDLKNMYVRVTFAGQHAIEIGRDQRLTLVKGEETPIDVKIPVNPTWIRNDELDFKIEFISRGIIENVIIRCAHVSKEVMQFNRSLQCVLPGESAPFLNFRLAKGHDLMLPTVASK